MSAGWIDERLKVGNLEISKALQEKIVKGINKLLGEDIAVISSPEIGKYLEKGPIRISDKTSEIRRGKGEKSFSSYTQDICSFSLIELPGCCGVLVSFHMYIEEKYRGKGIATFLQEIKEDIARENNYTVLLGTVRSDNPIEIHTLEKSGWKKINSFKNHRTYNDVEIWTKEIKYK